MPPLVSTTCFLSCAPLALGSLNDVALVAFDLEKLILAALKASGRTEGVRKIAARFGVNPSTVQRIGRPFDAASVAA